MALPPIAKATLQAAIINAGSNVLAQGIQAHRAEKPFELDTPALFQFTTCAFVLSPLTFIWLNWLESTFPGLDDKSLRADASKARKEKDPKPRLNVTNTVAKILVDQSIGGTWSTVAFIATMGLLRGQAYEVIVDQVRNDFWPIMIAGLKLWPMVSVLNFTIVPVDQRLLVGSLFGVVWAIYLSLIAG